MDLLESLNDEQKKVVLVTDGPVLVVAGPGSGKTRALTHKIAHLVNEHKALGHEILAVTFTNKAAAEMKDRVSGLVSESNFSWIGTFHSICSKILRIEAEVAGLSKDFVIYDTDDSTKLLKDIILELNLDPKEFNPNNVLYTISRAKSELIAITQFQGFASNPFYKKVSEIFPKYQKALKDNNAVDFSDLLYLTTKLFNESEEVLEKYQNKFKYILVDEYQDTNTVQYVLVKKLADKHKNLTVVGDISQSIYSWRGADYRNMVQFQKDYPEANLFQLAKNYRSTEHIIQAAQKIISNNSTHIPLELYTDNGRGSKIKICEAMNERSEARYVVNVVSTNVGDSGNSEYEPCETSDYKDFAVLYRTNAQSRIIEEAFVTANIPYKIVGGVRFYDRKEIKDVLSYLKVFYNPKDSISWLRCINTPTRGIGKKSYEKIKESKFDIEQINSLTKLDWGNKKELSPLSAIDTVLKDFGYLEYLNDGTEESLSRIENLKELRAVSAQYKTLEEFLENIALVEASSRALEGMDDAVTLMTLHAAKGLEFKNVFIVGMEEGIFPHSRSMADKEELEEERRLCYVGITRAMQKLYLTYALNRNLYGQTSNSLVSRFIAELPEELIDFEIAPY